MKTYNCFIVDDEPLAIEVIEDHLTKLQNFVVVGNHTDSVDAFVQYKNAKVDLLFIDIEMPDFTGLEFIRSLKNRPEIIITTAYRNFAVQGFDLDILDYLVKPISFERFMQSINKFINKKGNQHIIESVIEEPQFIIVRADRKNKKIFLDDILYVEGLKDYVKIVLKDKQVLTKQSIGNFEKYLPFNRFFRVHKSFIVAIDKITAYTLNDVEIEQLEIPIGRSYKKIFFDRMQQNK
ncbi:response regulator [Flavobacteriaceae bacterium AU392]|nr:DNA-binding response regulator [Flavobacteriaceae bacterium]RKM85592.1 response regulator [Flavobacteriaceae bacterium AU392]